MSASPLRHVLATLLMAAACGSAAVTAQPTSAQSVGPSSSPAALDPARPTVSGILVAKPISGEGNLPAACRDRDQTSLGAAVMQRRGLVICTEEGRLILLEISAQTGIYARYWGRYSLGRLSDGDHLNAWGVLRDNGYLLDPTAAVQDTDIQEAFVDSQDFIARSGFRLTLYVLESAAGGPVHGIVYAVRGGMSRITLCGGRTGTWADLTAGRTIDVTRSLFNRRLMTYIHSASVRLAGCR